METAGNDEFFPIILRAWMECETEMNNPVHMVFIRLILTANSSTPLIQNVFQ
jgi:hypothetical protein